MNVINVIYTETVSQHSNNNKHDSQILLFKVSFNNEEHLEITL